MCFLKIINLLGVIFVQDGVGTHVGPGRSISNHLVILEYFFMHKMLSKLQAVVYFTCADDGIGKFDRSMLSQQDSMDFFIFGLNEPEKICDSRDDPGDVCEWTGVICNGDGEVEEFQWICKNEDGTGTLGFEFLPCSMKSLRMFMNALSSTIQLAGLPEKMEVISLASNKLTANPTKDTSPWWVGPVPQFWGKPRTFSNPLSCFCHGADPIDGHRKVVGQDQYPALGEVRETAKLLPRGESPWWRDEGRHLLILCLFSIRGMRLAHMHNAKSREHAHTCRKARAIFKLRYKNKTNKLTGSLDLDSLPHAFRKLYLSNNKFTVRRSEDPGTGPWHVSGGGVSPEHIHHHRDKTRALVASMICIGTCSENSRSPRIKFVRHMFNTNSPEKSPSKTFPNASKV